MFVDMIVDVLSSFSLQIISNIFLPIMKSTQSTTIFPNIHHLNSHQQSPIDLSLSLKQDKSYSRPKMLRIAYPPISDHRRKQNSNRIMLQSYVSNVFVYSMQKRYEEVWEEQNQNKIKRQLGPNAVGSRKILQPISFIGKQAPIKYYKQYKNLQKTLLKKQYSYLALQSSIQGKQGEFSEAKDNPSVLLLQKAQSMMVLPLCLGLVKSKGEANILNLTNYNLGDRYIIALAAGLKKAKNIERCLLGANRITDLGLGELAKAFGQEIVSLDLSNNKITQIDQRLLDMIVESDYKLQEINLSNNLLKISASQSLLRSSKYSKHLIKLNLCKNRLNSSCSDALYQLIEKSTVLEELYIGTNYLSSKVGERIFNLLAGNKSLKVVDYSLNQLGDNPDSNCANAVGNCLRINKVMQHLDISFNNFGKEATQIIAEGLQPNKHLYGFHYKGNYGWVNSKGFLILEQKQETLLGTIDNNHINSFQVTVIRENHSLGSQPLKNVCWICEGWHQQQFKLSLPKSEDKVLAYIHFDFEGYEPRLISQGDLHVRYITMVPPKKYRYFFSANNQIIYDTSSQLEQLPIAQVHSFQIDHVQQEFSVAKTNIKTSKSRKIVNQYNQIMVKTLPRFTGLVNRKIKQPWSFDKSIWAKQWKLDDEQLLKKCFQRDWKQSKIMNLIKNQADQDKVRSLLWMNYSSIKTIYKQFSAWNPFGDVWAVANQPFTQFCQQSKIINKDTPLKITDLTFITTNSMSGADWKGNSLVPERGLVRFRFMESLARLAQQKFKKNGVFDNFADSVEMLLKDHLLPLVPMYNANQWRLQKYFVEQNDLLLKKYRPIFTSIYKRNSKLKVKPGEKSFMCLAQFRSIIQRSNIGIHTSQRDIFVSFNCSMMTQVDEIQNQRFMKMTEIEFIQGMARIAQCLPRQCCIEYQDSPALHVRFQWVIHQLKSLCPEDIKAQFPDTTISMFNTSEEEQL